MNHLNLNKPITPRNKYNKNTNKLQNTHSTHRTIHSQSEIKKESRTKHKKEIS